MPDDDLFASNTFHIDLICGSYPIGMNTNSEGKLVKMFLQGGWSHRPCTARLLSVVTELCSELMKTKAGYAAAIKILRRINCPVGQNGKHLSCCDDFANLMIAYQGEPAGND